MRKILYLLTKGPDQFSKDLLVPASPDQDVSVVLMQNGITLPEVPASRIYALSEDVAARKVASPFPTVSYQDLLRMIFDADTVVAL